MNNKKNFLHLLTTCNRDPKFFFLVMLKLGLKVISEGSAAMKMCTRFGRFYKYISDFARDCMQRPDNSAIYKCIVPGLTCPSIIIQTPEVRGSI